MGITGISTSVPLSYLEPQHSECATDSMGGWKDRSCAKELKIIIDAGSGRRRGKMGLVSDVG